MTATRIVPDAVPRHLRDMNLRDRNLRDRNLEGPPGRPHPGPCDRQRCRSHARGGGPGPPQEGAHHPHRRRPGRRAAADAEPRRPASTAARTAAPVRRPTQSAAATTRPSHRTTATATAAPTAAPASRRPGTTAPARRRCPHRRTSATPPLPGRLSGPSPDRGHRRRRVTTTASARATRSTRTNAALAPTAPTSAIRPEAADSPGPTAAASTGASPFRRRTTTTRTAATTRSVATSSTSGAAATAGTAATARPLPLIAPQPRPQPARRPPLRIVTPPDPEARTRRRRRLWVGALVSLACAGLFAIVGVRVLLAQGQAPVDQLESQVTAAQAENQRLRLDVARLESPSRIVAEAQARLGMVPPAVVIYLPAQTTTPAG